MHRLLAPEYVYSEAIDDSLHDYITTSPNTAPQQHIAVPHTHNSVEKSDILSSSITNCYKSHAEDVSNNKQNVDEQQIHTISSSDEELMEENTIEEEIPNISSSESSDFQGFDDYNIPNSSGIGNDTTLENFNIYKNYMERHSDEDFNEYIVDSECTVGEEDDGDEQIAIDENARIIYCSKGKIIPKRSPPYQSNVCTLNKRRRNDIEENYTAKSSNQLRTPPDQIVEVNSDSTTNSLKQKRELINNKFHLNLCQQNYKTNNNPNKCSTESTSEFPVSSPSNPQQPRGGKYPRPPLLKNTLPADSFERQLAMITSCNPQMTLAEKIQSWDVEEEPSDLEDVKKFDEEFKRLENQKRLEIKQRQKSGRNKNNQYKNYDFYAFRQMILDNIKEKKHQKNNKTGQGTSGGPSGGKCLETSGSESSKSVVHVDDRPSTSAVAQQQLQQRRSKHQLFFEVGESKKRIIKDISKRNQNSTTPPQTSSSENERDCFKKSKNNARQHQSHIHDTLICHSSSEEAISQDAPAHLQLPTNNKHSEGILKNIRKKSPGGQTSLNIPSKSIGKKELTRNSRLVTNEELQSFFRPHRINRERDKCNRSFTNEVEENSFSIIEMRLDFNNEKKSEMMLEEKQELFKTPIIPQKYLSNPLMTAEYDSQSPTKNFKTTDQINVANSLLKEDKLSNDVLQDKIEIKSVVDDLDGVYHQQHEFCNYLGLTGMSTATAMANAVAELAQCNLARRSMRVLRQQQQERRIKSAKKERLLETQKIKQLKDIDTQEKGSCDIIPVIDREQRTLLKSDDWSYSRASEPAVSFEEHKKKTNKNSFKKSQKKSSKKSHKSNVTVKNDSEIKILSNVAAKNTEEVANLSSECLENISQPIRETLMRRAKQHKQDAHEITSEIDAKSVKSNKTQRAHSIENTSLLEKENVARSSTSPALSTNKSILRNIRGRSEIIYEQKQKVLDQAANSMPRIEYVCDAGSIEKSIDIKCTSPLSKGEGFKRDEIINEDSNVEEMRLFTTGINLISSSPTVLQKKLQMALEESRKSKPSIFIVQSLESKKDDVNNLNMQCTFSPKNLAAPKSLSEIHKVHEINNDFKESIKTSHTKFNKKNESKVFKTRKGKKYPISKRRLRKRKIIVIKSLNPKRNSYEGLNAIKRELRSSPRINKNQIKNSLTKKTKNFKQKSDQQLALCNEGKSFRTVHTETKDLEIYLKNDNNHTKTCLMAKASALLERSRRMSLRGSHNMINNKNKFSSIIKKSKLNLYDTKTQNFKTKHDNTTNESKKVRSSSKIQLYKTEQNLKNQVTTRRNMSPALNLLENENVVVSSTTNTYDEKSAYEPLATQSPIALRNHNTAPYATASSPIQTKDQQTQCNVSYGVHYLKTPPTPIQPMRNPLKTEHGDILYIYNELDILIVIQEHLVSFWKCSKLINMLITPSQLPTCTHQTAQHIESTLLKQDVVENSSNNLLGYPALSSSLMEPNECNEWIQLGELRRLNLDFEISVPYANRICLHNSTPIYLEMRALQLPKNHRECNLLSLYINIYYYHDEDMVAKRNSIPLDSIQSDINKVNYTTLTDSRYFIMTWPQENLLGKTRSGLCKYSLTPQLDTLASIREFKSMHHTIRYLECMSDDKLIGFGETQVSIWDYRSGDVLMNFDFEIPMGRNIGSIYFSSQDIEENNMLILHQFRDLQDNGQTDLMTIASTVTPTQPSYKVLQEVNLPTPAFKVIKSAIRTGDHLVVTGQYGDELWISLTNPRLISVIPNIEDNKRFYSRERSQLIELTKRTLNVNSLANHVLQLAAGLALN